MQSFGTDKWYFDGVGVVFCIRLMWCQLGINTNVLPFSVNVWFDSAVNMQPLCACTQGECRGPRLVLHEINSELMAELGRNRWRCSNLLIFPESICCELQISNATDMLNITAPAWYISWALFFLKSCWCVVGVVSSDSLSKACHLLL